MNEMVMTVNEIENDGKTIHLYFSPSFKRFVAYGYSAYLSVKVIHNLNTQYDVDLQMPYIVLEVEQMGRLLLSLGYRNLQSSFEQYDYLQLEALREIDEGKYKEWAYFYRSHCMVEDNSSTV